MPNSDQLKYMKKDNITPIPQRASRPRKKPEPITFPKPAPVASPTPSLRTDDELRIFVQQCVTQALRDHDDKLVRTFYKVMMDWPIAEIMVMGEEQAVAICRSILEDAQ